MMLRLRNSLFLAVAALLFLGEVAGPLTARAETRVGGTLSGQTHWTKANSPYVVVEDLDVPVGSVLTIDAGVVVRFKPNLADQKGLKPFDLELVVRGTLTATGADGDSVYFTSDAVDVTRGDWWGIILPEAGGKVSLDRVVIEFANQGIYADRAEVNLTRSQIRSCNIAGLQLQEATGRITRNLVTDIGNFGGTGKGVYFLRTTNVVFDGNLVIGNQTGMSLERDSNCRVTNSLFSLCKTNGIIVGASNPELTGNNITQNEFGLFLFGGSRPKIRGNNIFGNGTYEVKVGEYSKPADGRNLVLDLGGNWWGDVTADAVLEKIEDGFDDPNVGAVLKIEPILKEAVRGGN